jgi:hypothetical protein
MGGGIRRESDKTTRSRVILRARKKVDSESGTPSGGSPKPRPCWEFQLVSTTSAGRKIKSGAPVFGTLTAGRILVNSAQLGTLGSVPDNVARLITSSIKGREVQLVGEIASVAAPNLITAVLCIVE